MTIEAFLAFLALVLALVGIAPPLRNYYLVNIAVAVLCVCVVLITGAVKL